jgi:hypothetical protein
MPQANPNYNLFVLKPELVKEWHPTKNAPLKPQAITPGSGKKVWWICSEGHEWQAVVYSRSRGSGCPYCNNWNSVDDNGVTVANSGFKMEWHPTANLNLNPAKWSTRDLDRVWWICRKGHEWQATFKARVKGKGCPTCDQLQKGNIQSRKMTAQYDGSAAAMTEATPEIESLESILGTDVRKVKRYMTRATVTIEVPTTNDFFYAQMKNFSHEGMCLETSTSLTPGTKVSIKLDKSLFATSQQNFDSIVKWCEGLRDEEGSVYNFGLGIKFI